MTQLPLDQAIPRFKVNEENVDIFVNGDANTSYTTSNSVSVPTIQNFLKIQANNINAFVQNVYANVIIAETTAVAAANAALISQTSAANSANIAVNAQTAAEAARDETLAVAVNPADFASAAQGVKADTALQADDIGTIATQNSDTISITGGTINNISGNNVTFNFGSFVTLGVNTFNANTGTIVVFAANTAKANTANLVTITSNSVTANNGNIVTVTANTANVNTLKVNNSLTVSNGGLVSGGTFNVSSVSSFTNAVTFSNTANIAVGNFKMSGGNTTFKWLSTDGAGNLSFAQPAIADLSDGQSTVDTLNGNIIALSIALG